MLSYLRRLTSADDVSRARGQGRATSEPLLNVSTGLYSSDGAGRTRFTYKSRSVRFGPMPSPAGARGGMESTHDVPRLLPARPTIEGGSHSRMQIHRVHHFSQLYFIDWFHTLVEMRCRSLLPLFVIVYFSAFSLLAALFLLVNDQCDLGLKGPVEAFALSVETWLTIGYGVPDPGFRGCVGGVAILIGQGLVGLLLNSIVLGIVFMHLSSGARRGLSLLFFRPSRDTADLGALVSYDPTL